MSRSHSFRKELRQSSATRGRADVRWCAAFIRSGACALVCFLAHCDFGPVEPQELVPSQPLLIASSADSLVIGWEPPQDSESRLVLNSYVLYSRHRSEASWRVVDTIRADGSAPQAVLLHEYFGNGVFEFAVQSLGAAGLQSALHLSTDAHALPSSGWRVDWHKP